MTARPALVTFARKFGIIGDALNRLHRSHPGIADRVSPLREVVGFRNLLIHGYSIVIPDRVRDHAEHDLPELRGIVRELLSGYEPPED